MHDELVIEATGIRVTLHGTTIAEFEGEKISSFRQYWDEIELLEQLTPPPKTDPQVGPRTSQGTRRSVT